MIEYDESYLDRTGWDESHLGVKCDHEHSSLFFRESVKEDMLGKFGAAVTTASITTTTRGWKSSSSVQMRIGDGAGEGI